MEMMLNPLPSRTWNRLGMNESFIKMDAPLENLIPSRDSSPAGVRWSENAEGWEGLQTGMGRDMGVLTADAPVCQAETGAGAVMTQPLILRYRYEDGQCSRSRLRLVAGKDSVLSVIVVLESPDHSGGISALQTEIAAEAGARVHLSVAQLLGSSFVCLNDIGGRCEDSARIEVTKLELGASRLFAGTTIDLAGTESDFQTDAAYHVLPEQQVDLNYVALHHGKRSNSLIGVSGTVEDGGRKIFRGTIDFQRGCAGSVGKETESVLLLGDRVVNQSIPLILCKEEDVEGSHGASIGQLDEKVLFYLASRGIPLEEAQQMIAQSRIDAVCSRIPDEAIRHQIHEFEQRRRC